jgi:excinuclease ABC subunit A
MAASVEPGVTMELPLTGEVLSRALSPLSRRCEMDARVNRPENSDFEADGGFVRVQGARENNLKDVSLDIPPQCACGVTGVSGSGKSSLAFGTHYAEAQRRYLESVSPYARRLFHQMAVPEVDSVEACRRL